MQEKEILNEVILGYRKVIEARYQFEHITSTYEIPDSFDKERVALFRDYFLNNIYPHPEKREELEGAFNSLDNYIKQPEKLMSIIVDSASLIFKFGRHLPKIMMAGIKALKSFRAATQFESKLVQNAIEMKLEAPYDANDINTLIRGLSLQDINEFTKNNEALFETLHDRKLVKKIKEIVDHLITKMKKRPKVYSQEEIRGLEIGRNIISEGDFLFEQLNEEEQHNIFEFVLAMEASVLEELFEEE